MLDSGWIKLHRGLKDSSIFSAKAEYLKVWIYLLLSVNVKECKFPFNGEDVTVAAGSIITSRDKIAKECGISDQTVRSALEYLKSTSRVTSKSTNKYTVISIQNWESYQQINQQSNKPVTNQQQTSNHKQEDKEIKNNKYSSLSDIVDSDLQEISKEYEVTITFVRSKFEDLKNYCGSKNKRYANYKLTLKNWVKRDYEKNGGKLKQLPDEIDRKRRALAEQFGVFN